MVAFRSVGRNPDDYVRAVVRLHSEYKCGTIGFRRNRTFKVPRVGRGVRVRHA